MKSRRELMFGAAGLGVGALMVATAAQARTLSASASPLIIGVGEGAVTVTASGGVPPYSYEWIRTGGSPYIEATDPYSDVTEFQWNGPYNTPPRVSNWTCHVTDSTSTTVGVSIHATYAES